MTTSIDSLIFRWTAAELAGDVETLDQMLTPHFYAVGPLGFVLSKPAWLARHRGGDLKYKEFDLDEVDTREHGNATLVVGRHRAKGAFQGQPIPEALRASLVLVEDRPATRIAALHLSFSAGTAGSPPHPGAALRR